MASAEGTADAGGCEPEPEWILVHDQDDRTVVSLQQVGGGAQTSAQAAASSEPQSPTACPQGQVQVGEMEVAQTPPHQELLGPHSATTPWGAKAANSSSLGAGFGWRIARGPRCRAGCCAPVVLAGRSRLGHTDGSTSLRRVEHPGQSRCYWRPLRRLSGLGFSSRPHWTSGRHLASWGSSMSPRLHLPRHLDLRQRGAKAQGSDDAALPLNSQGAGWAARARPEGTTLAAERGNARLGLCTNKSAISHCQSQQEESFSCPGS